MERDQATNSRKGNKIIKARYYSADLKTRRDQEPKNVNNAALVAGEGKEIAFSYLVSR
jgi:hypothetical protein